MQIGEEVEALVVVPGVSRENARALQAHAIAKVFARLVEDLVEGPTHGEHRRPGVETQTAGFDLAKLAARRRGALDHRHVEPARRKQERGDEPAYPRSDDDDFPGSHACALSGPRGPKRQLTWSPRLSIFNDS